MFNIIEGISTTDQQIFVSQLAEAMVIDVGIIESYKQSTGTCSVHSFQILNGLPAMYTGVELIREGGVGNAFQHDVVGSLCLLFAPRSVALSLKDRQIDASRPMYDKAGIKCLAISTAVNTPLRMGFTSTGAFRIAGANYVVEINENGISYTDGTNSAQVGQSAVLANGSVTIENEGDGSYVVQLIRTSDKYVMHRFSYSSDGTCQVQHVQQADMTESEIADPSTFQNYMWVDTFSTDGTRKLLLQDNQMSEIMHVTLGGTGDVEISNKGGTKITISVDGSVSISTDSNNVSITGNVSIDGTLDVTGATTLSDTLNVSGNTTIDGNLSAAGGNLTAEA